MVELCAVDRLVVQHEFALVIQVHEVRRGFLAQAVALAARSVKDDPHGASAEVGGAASLPAPAADALQPPLPPRG
ncbi:hypothetical protein [Streptomyces sp. NPDC002758]